MTQLTKKNRTLFPSPFTDFFTSERLMPDAFDLSKDLFNFNGETLFIPSANVVENEKNFTIEIAAPGLEKKDFKVEITNNILTVSSEQEEEKKEEKKNYKRREFFYNSFSRSFSLPDNSLPDKIDAKYDNGVLTLTLPKKEVTASKPVKEIKVN
jgi:HSP20 family protein